MKKITGALVTMILAIQFAQGQGSLYLSNLDQPATDNKTVGSDSWLAMRFRTGTNFGGYVLNSIQLLMDARTGNPSNFAVFIYDLGDSAPGTSLGSLNGGDPGASGVYTYNTLGISLSPATAYFVVLTSGTPTADGAYYWRTASGPFYSSTDSWFLSAGYESSTDGSSWTFTRPRPLQFAVYATAVPEPSSALLALLGGVMCGIPFFRRGSTNSRCKR